MKKTFLALALLTSALASAQICLDVTEPFTNNICAQEAKTTLYFNVAGERNEIVIEPLESESTSECAQVKSNTSTDTENSTDNTTESNDQQQTPAVPAQSRSTDYMIAYTLIHSDEKEVVIGIEIYRKNTENKAELIAFSTTTTDWNVEATRALEISTDESITITFTAYQK